MSKRDLLFITEGNIDEPKFIEKILNKCLPNVEYNIYSYSTTIHTLAKKIFNKKIEIDEDLDIKGVLKEQEKDIHKRRILDKSYTDIILVFDFEPHCDSPEFEKVKKMIEYFNDSSNMGKLYINYPMMQSYKHLKKMPDYDFKNRTIETVDVSNYKKIIDKESQYKKLGDYNYPIIMGIIGHHLMKANYILSGNYKLMNKKEFINLDYVKIYDLELEYNIKKQMVYVLNTFVFFVIEYNSTIMLEKIIDFV